MTDSDSGVWVSCHLCWGAADGAAFYWLLGLPDATPVEAGICIDCSATLQRLAALPPGLPIGPVRAMAFEMYLLHPYRT
jgi:hypothetical protein